MNKVLALLFFFAFFVTCYCNNNVFSIGGRCLTSPVISDFDPQKFKGIWYESMRFPNVYEGDSDDTVCVKKQFNYLDKTHMTFNATSYKPLFGNDAQFNGELELVKESEPNKYNVKFSVDFFTFSTIQLEGKFDIWDTDYSTYALVYSCSPYKVFVLNFKTEAVWILSRTKAPLSNSIISKLKAQLESKKLNSTQLESIDQDCDSQF